MPKTLKRDLPLTHRPTGKGRRLTPTEQLMIRAEKGVKSVRVTAKEYGVCPDTVQRIFNSDEMQLKQEQITRVKESMSGNLYLTAHRSIEIVNDKIEDASASQAAVIAGIMIDKARLIEGQSTANHAHAFLNIVNDEPV